ncbi:MAG: hypothetical protein MK193_07925 [Lentisphaeria bacterium]|nr:hypothetical protein [Lentisphaeria bacterium]
MKMLKTLFFIITLSLLHIHSLKAEEQGKQKAEKPLSLTNIKSDRSKMSFKKKQAVYEENVQIHHENVSIYCAVMTVDFNDDLEVVRIVAESPEGQLIVRQGTNKAVGTKATYSEVDGTLVFEGATTIYADQFKIVNAENLKYDVTEQLFSYDGGDTIIMSEQEKLKVFGEEDPEEDKKEDEEESEEQETPAKDKL